MYGVKHRLTSNVNYEVFCQNVKTELLLRGQRIADKVEY